MHTFYVLKARVGIQKYRLKLFIYWNQCIFNILVFFFIIIFRH